RGWKRFVTTFLLFYAQIILTQFALGFASLLATPWWLTVSNVIISTLVLLYLLRVFGQKKIALYFHDLKVSLIKAIPKLHQDPLWSILTGLGFLVVVWLLFLGT